MSGPTNTSDPGRQRNGSNALKQGKAVWESLTLLDRTGEKWRRFQTRRIQEESCMDFLICCIDGRGRDSGMVSWRVTGFAAHESYSPSNPRGEEVFVFCAITRGEKLHRVFVTSHVTFKITCVFVFSAGS
eukprot:GEMP01070690.1.p1 GENE.GEMP01070690.1~~GEMP01070690.1.p1  ORF type:complete len:130 (+),score=9.71 GEMP01070690.1:252-641(+)